MYTENALKDFVLCGKACASNLLARFAPGAYVRLTQQTGRGSDEESAASVAAYFWRSFHDYRLQLGLEPAAFEAFLRGKRVLEYGPGDVLGVALLFYAHGAERVLCVDRFPLQNVSDKNAEIYRHVIAQLPEALQPRAWAAFAEPGRPQSGLRPECVEYRVTANGLARDPAAFDLIVSRAVLEHVNSLEATLQDVERSLAPGGVSIHSVDLRSHNLDRFRPFDFLTWPEPLYRLMYSHKGFPNRWRPDAYRRILRQTRLQLVRMEPTSRLDTADVERIKPKVARHLRAATSEDLSWTGFWMVLRQATAS